MAKKKKQSGHQGEEHPETVPNPAQDANSSWPMCPLCDMAPTGRYYCPKCGGETDFFWHSGINSLGDDQKQSIRRSAGRIFLPYLAVAAVYVTSWLFIYIFILTKCLSCFENPR